MPGNNYEFTQPIQLRFNELISGVRSDVAVKVFGDDLDMLLARRGKQIAGGAAAASGARPTCKIEQVAGLPMLTVEHRPRRRCRATASTSADVQDVVEIAIGGKSAGQALRGRPALRHRRAPAGAAARTIEALRRLPIPLPPAKRRRRTDADGAGGAAAQIRYVPLSSVATVDAAPGPNQISRENGKRRVVVTANVRGRDLGSFVAEAQQAVAEQVKLPPGYWIGWGGQFEQLVVRDAAAARSSCPSRCCWSSCCCS